MNRLKNWTSSSSTASSRRGVVSECQKRAWLPGAAVAAVLSLMMAPLPVEGALDSKGTEFWLAFPGNLGGPTLTLFITSDVNTSGTVDIPGLAFSTPFNVTAGTVTSVGIPSGAAIDTSDTVENKGIHVTALNEVTVYGLNRISATTDAYLGLPIDILGTEYIVLSYQNSNVVNGTQFAIVGIANNTTVSITPSVTTGNRAAGVAYDIVLNEGQTYQLRNGTSPNDLTGTLITSNNPVAVFGSHQCANIPPGFGACDHIVEQLPPTTTWGENFVTMPLATRQNGDTFRFLAAVNGTDVLVNGTVVATLDRGEFHEQIINGPAQITSDQPVLVAQYSNGTNFDGVTSDPFMMLIPPFEQFLGGYTVTTPASGFSINFINVVAPDAAVGNITLDGTPIPAQNFQAIGTSGFSGTQVAVGLGSHNLVGNLPFGVFVYGFDSADSYGYPGGASLSEVVTVRNLILSPEFANVLVGTQHCVDALVTDQNNSPVPSIRVDIAVSGANELADFVFTNANGVAQFCYLGLNPGTDTIEASVGALNDAVTATVGDVAVFIDAVIPTRASVNGGTPMMLIGEGLDTLDELFVGGVPITDFTALDTNTATFTAPAHASGFVNLTADLQGNVVLLPNAFLYVNSATRTVNITAGDSVDDFRMIGIPLAGNVSSAGQTNAHSFTRTTTPSLAQQFLNQLDFDDPTVARIFRFNGTDYDEGLDIPGDIFTSGIGFWIISSETIALNLRGSDSNQFVTHQDGTVSPFPPVVVFLHPGWNQVCPGLAGVTLSVENTFVTDGEIFVPVVDPNNTLTNQRFFEFTGNADSPYRSVKTLDGTESYWHFNFTENPLLLFFGGLGGPALAEPNRATRSGALRAFLKRDFSTSALPASVRRAITGNSRGVTRAVARAEADSPPAPPSAVTMNRNSESGGGGCFIATAAYGSTMDPRLHSLKTLKDEEVRRTLPGRDFTLTYYANSPAFAGYLRSHSTSRALARRLLQPVVRAAER